jgi:5'-3' exonuclease
VVVTGDRDLFALIDDDRQISVLYTGRGPAQLITGDQVREQYGIEPSQYVDMAVLRGDPSDGLPGVKGIGAKTATALLQEFGSLAALRTAAAEGSAALKPKIRENIIAANDYLDAALRVVRPVADLPLPVLGAAGSRPSAIDTARVEQLGVQWNSKASLGRIAAVMQAHATDE